MIRSFSIVVLTCFLLAGYHLIESKVITAEKSSAGVSGQHHGVRPLTKSTYYGGRGGKSFDDVLDNYLDPSPIMNVNSITISYRDKVDSIQVTYIRVRRGILFRAPTHGILKSKPTRITLGPYEHIVKVEGQTDGKYITQLTITTDAWKKGKTVYGPFGKNGTQSFSLEGFIVAFYGGYGLMHLNSIGVYSMKELKKSDMFGGTGGNPFDDNSEILQPPAAQFIGVSQIMIWSSDVVEAIQVLYFLQGVDYFIANQHGEQNNGNLTTLHFPDDEILVTIEGLTEDDYISQVTFVTQKPDGSKGRYGPFGKTGKCPFSISANIVAIHGTSGSRINKIGVYYV
jgi:hypothetical protein